MAKPTKKQVASALDVLRRLSDDAYAPKAPKKPTPTPTVKEPPMNPLIIGSGTGGGGTPTPTPTPTPSAGNWIKPANWTAFLAAYAAAGSLDVIDISGPWYSPSLPRVFSPDRSIPGSGAILIGNRSQVAQIKLNAADANTAFVGWNLSGDATQGNNNESPTGNSGFYAVASSKFGLWGCNIGQGEFGVYCDQACTDFIIQNNNVYFNRDDFLRSDGNTARILIDGNHLEDNLYRTYFYYFTDGTPPVFVLDPGGATFVDTNHCDGGQFFSVGGSRSDITITNNFIKNQGQTFWLTAGQVTRVKIAGNESYTGYLFALGTDAGGATHVEVSSNQFYGHPDRLPLFSSGVQIDLLSPGGAGPFRGGLNTFAPGSVVNVDGRFNATAAINGDVVTAPTLPNFSLPSVNVVDLPSLIARPSFTAYAGPKSPVGRPNIYGPGGSLSSYSLGAKLSVNPPRAKGYEVGGEASYQTRWTLNGSVVRSGTGETYMTYTAGVAGSLFTETSMDGGLTWSAPSNTVTVS